MMLSNLIHAFSMKKNVYFNMNSYRGDRANWDTFIIYRHGADNNRVRDSKQSFKLGVIFVLVTWASNK